MIELQNISKRYGRIQALEHLTLKSDRHQIIGLLGKNGAGKTTTLNIITGYFPPDEGNILINGVNMTTDSRKCKRQIGYLPEKPPLYDEMTVWDYLFFVSSLKEIDKRDIPMHLNEILKLCGLQEVSGRVIGHLSRGYRQRVGIAQALCGNPELIILDEPTVGLDPGQVAEIRKLIHELGRDHTVIFSSHILSEVQQLCDRVIILHHGKMIRDVCIGDSSDSTKLFLRISVMLNKDAFLKAVRGLDGIQKTEVLISDDDKVTEARLMCIRQPGQPDIRIRLFHLLAAMDAPILKLVPEQNSLEAIFLQMTEEETDR